MLSQQPERLSFYEVSQRKTVSYDIAYLWNLKQ